MRSDVRVRFAPSPTGQLHIGNARTAILNWIVARQSHGQFILRIEDTDIDRSTAQSEESILADLNWLGLDWDEGPDKNAAYGPYRQSERRDKYAELLQTLKRDDKAYPCFCSPDELAAKRHAAITAQRPVRYDRTCLALSESERTKRLASGPPIWRFRVESDEIRWLDLVKGEMIFPGDEIGDFVLVRANGSPTYNFAAAVDDALMKISHVIRGDDHVSNTPKQLLLYDSLGKPTPQFAHIPMILGPDRTRLSKRHGATSVAEMRKTGFLAEALFNFLSLLGWSSESGEELLSRERLIEEFDFERMNRSPAIFDATKFAWMNGQYLRQLKSSELLRLARPFMQEAGLEITDDEIAEKTLTLVRDSAESLADLPNLVKPFYLDSVQPTDGQAIALSSKDSSQKIYWAFLRYSKRYDSMNMEAFRSIMKQVQKETGIMGKDLWMPIRVALTGKIHGVDLAMAAEMLGKEKCERFIHNLID